MRCTKCGSYIREPSCIACRRRPRFYVCKKCGTKIKNPEYRPSTRKTIPMTEFTCVWCKPPQEISGVENLLKHVLTSHKDRYDYIQNLVKKIKSKALGQTVIIGVQEELKNR